MVLSGEVVCVKYLSHATVDVVFVQPVLFEGIFVFAAICFLVLQLVVEQILVLVGHFQTELFVDYFYLSAGIVKEITVFYGDKMVIGEASFLLVET